MIKTIAANSGPIVLLLLLSLRALPSHAESDQQRIVSLSPHLTEIVFALGREKQLVGVSDYSDYPYSQGCIDKRCSVKLPSIANYQGADISAIIRAEPTLILAWEGGNNAQDIARLEQLGYPVFRSSPTNIETLMQEILSLGIALNAISKSKKLHEIMTAQAQKIRAQFANKKASALYYMSQQPLSGMGSDIWLNSLLSLCNIRNIYAKLPAAYAQFSVADIIRKQPEIVIAATHQDASSVTQFWAPHLQVFNPKVVVVNPDALHRFTPRVLPELALLCKKVHF
ncbi:MAG: vitamin B12 transport system substrate-binding protein [Glaciecola sp.]|jgi:vitamin B12 transport system substrate-binding protein